MLIARPVLQVLCPLIHRSGVGRNPTQTRFIAQARAWDQDNIHIQTREISLVLKHTKPNTTFSRTRRRFSVIAPLQHGHLTPPKSGEELHVTFIDKEGDEHKFEVASGDNLLDIAQSEELEMEGACGGSCACSTCHIIVESQEHYDSMPEPDDDENDMLDLAFGLTETSRLGCQVKMTKELDGLRVRLPSMTRNLQKSDFEGGKKGG